MIGVAIVQLPATGIVSIAPFKDPNVRSYFTWLPRNLGTSASTPLYKRSATYEGIQEDDLMENPSMDPPLGFAAAVGGSTISALASVYFEKILKDSVNPTSLWVRNVQLAFYSLFPALFIGIFYVDGERVAHDGFFAGYNWVVWTTVIFQAIGGILVSFCIKHADNITKNFAISISILIGLCVSVWVFEFTVTANVRPGSFPKSKWAFLTTACLQFFVGTCAVLLATYLYGNRGRGVKKR